MRWLLTASVKPAVAEALRRHGHQARTLSEVGLNDHADASDILRAATRSQLDVLTDNAAIAASPFADQVPFPRTIVYLMVGDGEIEQDDAVDRLFDRYARLSPGRLYTVTPSRVKIRQLPRVSRT